MTDFAKAREAMVSHQIAQRGVSDAALLRALREVPREAFVPDEIADAAYEDRALAIGACQTISQPYIVARMIELAGVREGQRVLDVGTGSGYGAAVLSGIAREVFTIERHAVLSEAAQARFAALGYDNIRARVGDGVQGWPEAAPFDAILVAAAAPLAPEALKAQLAIGAHLVLPLGPSWRQRLTRVTRQSKSTFVEEALDPVAFVPLVGAPEPSRAGTYVIGWSVSEEERSTLLARLPPRYANVIADHVTFATPVGADAPLPAEAHAQIVGHADDDAGVEAYVVAIDGRTDRPDGGVLHLTWSLAEGRRGKESNDVIAQYGWRSLAEPIPVHLIPARFGPR